MARKPLGASYWQQLAGNTEQRLNERVKKIMACPDDDAPMEWRDQENRFVCPSCSRVFKEKDGILAAYPDDDAYELSEEELTNLEELAATGKHSSEAESPEYLAHVLQLAGDLNEKLVLDVGCGSGWISRKLAETDAIVVAFDVMQTKGGLADLQGNAPDNISLIAGDGCRLPFLSESFDVIIAADLFSRLRRPERLAKEIGRVLHPEGKFFSIHDEIGEGSSAALAQTDPRLEGKKLSLADFRGIFTEGEMSMVPLFPGEPLNHQQKKGFLAKIKHQFAHTMKTGKRVLVGLRKGPTDPADRLLSHYDREQEEHR